MKKTGEFICAVLAGILIGIGGTAYLSCESKLAGAFLFTIGLITICEFGFYLFTGKVGYTLISEMKWAGKISFLARIALGNFLGTLCYGLAAGAAKPALHEAALKLCNQKLEQKWHAVLLLSVFCGVLMYIAVEGYRKNAAVQAGGMAKYISILLCIPTFILCGFEHSIADMAYFALASAMLPLAKDFRPETFGFLAIVLLGNAIGGALVPWCEKHFFMPKR